MAKRRYVVNGPFERYDTKPGETVTLDEDAPDVVLNVEIGALTLATEAEEESTEPEKEPCPRCVEEGMKRPPKFEAVEDLREHYADKHPGLVAPTSLREE